MNSCLSRSGKTGHFISTSASLSVRIWNSDMKSLTCASDQLLKSGWSLRRVSWLLCSSLRISLLWVKWLAQMILLKHIFSDVAQLAGNTFFLNSLNGGLAKQSLSESHLFCCDGNQYVSLMLPLKLLVRAVCVYVHLYVSVCAFLRAWSNKNDVSW